MRRVIVIGLVLMIVGVGAVPVSAAPLLVPDWTYTFDFSVSDGGFVPSHNVYESADAGVWVSGSGWHDNRLHYENGGYYAEVRQVNIFKEFGGAYTITDVDMLYDYTAGVGVGAVWIQKGDNSGWVSDSVPAVGSDLHLVWSGEVSTTGVRLYLPAGTTAYGSADPGGSVLVKSLTISGMGSNPFYVPPVVPPHYYPLLESDLFFPPPDQGWYFDYDLRGSDGVQYGLVGASAGRSPVLSPVSGRVVDVLISPPGSVVVESDDGLERWYLENVEDIEVIAGSAVTAGCRLGYSGFVDGVDPAALSAGLRSDYKVLVHKAEEVYSSALVAVFDNSPVIDWEGSLTYFTGAVVPCSGAAAVCTDQEWVGSTSDPTGARFLRIDERVLYLQTVIDVLDDQALYSFDVSVRGVGGSVRLNIEGVWLSDPIVLNVDPAVWTDVAVHFPALPKGFYRVKLIWDGVPESGDYAELAGSCLHVLGQSAMVCSFSPVVLTAGSGVAVGEGVRLSPSSSIYVPFDLDVGDYVAYGKVRSLSLSDPSLDVTGRVTDADDVALASAVTSWSAADGISPPSSGDYVDQLAWGVAWSVGFSVVADGSYRVYVDTPASNGTSVLVVAPLCVRPASEIDAVGGRPPVCGGCVSPADITPAPDIFNSLGLWITYLWCQLSCFFQQVLWYVSHAGDLVTRWFRDMFYFSPDRVVRLMAVFYPLRSRVPFGFFYEVGDLLLTLQGAMLAFYSPMTHSAPSGDLFGFTSYALGNFTEWFGDPEFWRGNVSTPLDGMYTGESTLGALGPYVGDMGAPIFFLLRFLSMTGVLWWIKFMNTSLFVIWTIRAVISRAFGGEVQTQIMSAFDQMDSLFPKNSWFGTTSRDWRIKR